MVRKDIIMKKTIKQDKYSRLYRRKKNDRNYDESSLPTRIRTEPTKNVRRQEKIGVAVKESIQT
jgi:hypothetical protein